MAVTLSEVVLVSSVARPTTRMLAVPTVCDHVTLAALVADWEPTASNVIAANVDVVRPIIRQKAAASLRAWRSVQDTGLVRGNIAGLGSGVDDPARNQRPL